MIKIPLFPLNIVALPFEEVPLHIFEPRYKKMIKESIENNTPFGIVLNNNGSIDNIGYLRSKDLLFLLYLKLENDYFLLQ